MHSSCVIRMRNISIIRLCLNVNSRLKPNVEIFRHFFRQGQWLVT